MVDVSVIIPCFNASNYIDECIGSIVRQTGVSVEIIAVEDRSTDDTWERLLEISKTVPNLHCERLESNRGQATARNTGMARARGRYVALLDSDDFYQADDVLKRWVNAAEQQQLDLCIAQYDVIGEDGVVRKAKEVPLIEGGVGSAMDSPSIVNTGQCWQVLYSRAFLEREKLVFSLRLRQREDRLFFIQAFILADRIGVTDITAIRYRDHPHSTMKRVDYGQLAQFNTHMEIMAGYLAPARIAARVHPDFERANAVAYWHQALEYWRPLIQAVISHDCGDNEVLIDPDDAAAAHAFLKRLHELTAHSGPLFLDNYHSGSRVTETSKIEATFDIARMALSANRLDIFLQILSKSGRVHHTALSDLIKTSEFEWAESAAMQYLKYSRCSDYTAEQISSQTPRLSTLVNRVILHVGMPKTGSSSLQEFFENNRFRMLRKGIHYPIFGTFREHGVRRVRSSGHLSAIKSILDDRDDNKIGQRLAAEISALPYPVDTLVISSENILSHVLLPRITDMATHPLMDVIDAIVEALGVEQVEIAGTFRRQDDWFNSLYREVTANPMNEFVSSPKRFFKTLETLGLFEYENIIKMCSASTKVSKCHFQSLGNVRKGGGSIPWFMSILGVSTDGLIADTGLRINKSFSDAAAANIRILKLMRLPKLDVEALFRKIVASKELSTSNFSLISPQDWDTFAPCLWQHLADFDKRFPGEARPKKSGTALTLLPDLMRTEPNFMPLSKQIETERIRAEYRYITGSKSWKITAPLRKTLETLKLIRSKLVGST